MNPQQMQQPQMIMPQGQVPQQPQVMMPGQQMAGQQMAGQMPMQGQQMPVQGQQMPGQQMMGQQMPAQNPNAAGMGAAAMQAQKMVPVSPNKDNPLSTQATLLISELRDNVVIMKDGSFRAVVACKSINFDLMSEMEREGVEYSYQNFLNSLKFTTQILV